ncbi:uncharacterized protein LOC141655221 [Silene latifolia]|uniref:uncharacterized protein LOC141655221 n=1 Tax=Silene latifolia TaxID=37657 RepID=UPI003D787F2D
MVGSKSEQQTAKKSKRKSNEGDKDSPFLELREISNTNGRRHTTTQSTKSKAPLYRNTSADLENIRSTQKTTSISRNTHSQLSSHISIDQFNINMLSTPIYQGMNLPSSTNGIQFDDGLMKDLKQMVDRYNVLAKSFRMARDRLYQGADGEVRLRLISARNTDGRAYNLPTVSEVAALIVGDMENTLIVGTLWLRNALYPILFPRGEDGHRLGIPHSQHSIASSSSNENTRDKLTLREWFAFRIQDRSSAKEYPTILMGGKLFQQFVADGYTMIESDRLKYIRFNQPKLRSENFKNLENVSAIGQTNPSSAGVRFIVPSSLLGSKGYMRETYQDTMTICRWCGYPNLFITFTCNPKWPEITRFVKRGLRPEDRPDILTRVFKLKLDELMRDLKERHIFGRTRAVVYTIEFQKRGLPHAHILLFLQRDDKFPESVDVEHAPCMIDGICSKKFPKRFNERTIVDADGYPVYKRRENGTTIEKNGKTIHNGYVVPYNADLLLKYRAHINVGWCNQARSIKYLFKYINKGYVRVTVSATSSNNDLQLTDEQLQTYALSEIESWLQRNGSSLHKFDNMPYPDVDILATCSNRLLADELSYDKDALKKEHEVLTSSMTDEQKSIYRKIMYSVQNGQGGVYFVYGYGGTGKTFLWKALCAGIRSKGEIVIAVASSGIAVILLPGGRTAHARLSIPINVDENSMCHGIQPGTDLAELLKRAKLILWDEAAMVNRYCFEALDRSLRDIMRTLPKGDPEKPFGGKVVVFGGDFPQILSVIPKGSRQDIVGLLIDSSPLWRYCKVLKLTKNMRLQVGSAESDVDEIKQFSEWILELGDGLAGGPNDGVANIELPKDILIQPGLDPIATIVESTYPSLKDHLGDPQYFTERVVLAPTHDVVEVVNDYVLDQIQKEEKVYLSSDEIGKEETNCGVRELYSTEFLNSIRCSGLPNHSLKLKVGAIVMLLRNIDQANRLCNGTRMEVNHLGNRVISATVISGSHIDSKVYIPRITLTPSDTTMFPVKFERRQFPLAVCFAMTINKSQG